MLDHSRQQGMNPTNHRWPSMSVGVIAVTLFLALLCASPCLAGKNAGGALIVHTQDAYTFSAGTVCTTTYGTPASCEEAVTRSDKDVGTVVWLLAAFPDTASPAVSGIYFGIDYDDSLYVDRWKLCAPAGSIELPDSGWPGTGTGNSVAFGTPIVGNRLFPFYAFKIDGGTDNSYFSTGINQTGGYAAFIDDAFPPVTDAVTRFGTVRWYAAGANDCPASGGMDTEDTEPPDTTPDAGSSEEQPADLIASTSSLTFIRVQTESDSLSLETARALSHVYDLKLSAVVLPDGIIAWATQDQLAQLQRDPIVSLATCDSIPHLSSAPGDPVDTRHIWNAIKRIPPNLDDARIDIDTICSGVVTPTLSQSSLLYSTPAQYLMRDVCVPIVFVESSGGSQNWTTDEQVQMRAQIIDGLVTYVNPPPASDVYYVFPWIDVQWIGYEPIDLDHDDLRWQVELYQQMGASASSAEEAGYEVAEMMRREHTCERCYLHVCVAADYWDHLFNDGWGSWSFRNGPSVIHVDANWDPLGPHLNRLTAAHEILHIFGAADEYYGAGDCSEAPDCQETYGYLAVPNENCAMCGPQQSCFMWDAMALPEAICIYTAGHVGWRDDDADGFLDPIDRHTGVFARIGDVNDPVYSADRVVITDDYDNVIKTLTPCGRSASMGCVLWDGTDDTGGPAPPLPSFRCYKNDWPMASIYLSEDDEVPVITECDVQETENGYWEVYFKFVDDDTRSGYVNTCSYPSGWPDLRSEYRNGTFLYERESDDPPILALRRQFQEPGWYDCRIDVSDGGGDHLASRVVSFHVGGVMGAMAVEDDGSAVKGGRPNPSQSGVEWRFGREKTRVDKIVVVDIGGRIVRRLSGPTDLDRGSRILWDGSDDNGVRAGAGKYFMVALAGNRAVVRGSTIVLR